jgi:iron complex transport system permease protein
MQTPKKYILLMTILIFTVLVNLLLGSVIIPKGELLKLISFQDFQNSAYHQIIFDYRLPKTIVGGLVGAGLGVSGLLMQSIFRNPIVGPYVLGLSSGAGLGVAMLILGSSIIGVSFVSSFSISLAAVLGSILTLLLIMSFYLRIKNMVSLLIVGLMIGIFSGAIISVLSYFTQAESLQKYVFWSMGNLGNLSWTEVLILFAVVVFSVAAVIFLIKPMNALLLGENYALSMGVQIKKVNFSVILLTGLLVGSITAFVGPIAFVGLAVPHLARMFFKTQLLQILFPAVVLIGAILMLICDTIAQLPGTVLTLPINSVTALLGAPLVVYMILKGKGAR